MDEMKTDLNYSKMRCALNATSRAIKTERKIYIVRVVDFHISQSKIKRSCVLLYYYHEVHVFRLLTGRAFFSVISGLYGLILIMDYQLYHNIMSHSQNVLLCFLSLAEYKTQLLWSSIYLLKYEALS